MAKTRRKAKTKPSKRKAKTKSRKAKTAAKKTIKKKKTKKVRATSARMASRTGVKRKPSTTAKSPRPLAGQRMAAPDYDNDPGCDFHDEHELTQPMAAAALAAAAAAPPKPVPDGNPVPFAQSTAATKHWPVDTANPSRFVVSYQPVTGPIVGAPGRRFLAQRNSGGRFHVGIDLFAHRGDTVVAVENGRIVAFYEFYPSSAGEMTFALLVEHANFVVNYGEVTGDSDTRFHWSVGDTVTAGQSIARVSTTDMTHFETYRLGTRRNQRWHPGEPRPPALLNPTAYLLALASH
jgi:murein DD-endopeptidase MepM/ murein hydrolase activator NlpD